MASIGADVHAVFLAIRDLLTRTILAAYPHLLSRAQGRAPHASPSGFELLGFDVLLDRVLKPWLIEVNIGPSLAASSPMDNHVKSKLLNDVYAMVAPTLAAEKPLAAQELGQAESFSPALLPRPFHDLNALLRSPPPLEAWPDACVNIVAQTMAEHSRAGTSFIPFLFFVFFLFFLNLSHLLPTSSLDRPLHPSLPLVCLPPIHGPHG
jgi:hypothetical protein